MTDELVKSGFGSILFRLVRVVIVLAVAIGMAFFLVSLKKAPEKKEIVKTPPGVHVTEVYPVSRTMTVETFGTIKPRTMIKVAFEVGGRISSVHPSFEEGGLVEKGELLVRLDSRSFELDLKAAKARVRQARADIKNLNQDILNLKADLVLSEQSLTLSGKERKRVRELVKNKFASENSLDKIEQQYLSAKIGLQAVKNRLSSANTLMHVKKAALDMAVADHGRADLALQKSNIYTGFHGFILEKYVEAGEFVSPGQVIGTIYEKGRLDVDVRIPLEQMKWIESFFKNGRTPSARVSMANIEGLTPDEWDAKVVRVKARVDEKTRTLPMTLEILKPNTIENPGFWMRPGAFVKCVIQGKTVENLYVLPRHLLKPGEVIYIVSNGTLRMKTVEIFRKFEEEVYVSFGLNPGDQVVSSPLPGALDGMALTVKKDGK